MKIHLFQSDFSVCVFNRNFFIIILQVFGLLDSLYFFKIISLFLIRDNLLYSSTPLAGQTQKFGLEWQKNGKIFYIMWNLAMKLARYPSG